MQKTSLHSYRQATKPIRRNLLNTSTFAQKIRPNFCECVELDRGVVQHVQFCGETLAVWYSSSSIDCEKAGISLDQATTTWT